MNKTKKDKTSYLLRDIPQKSMSEFQLEKAKYNADACELMTTRSFLLECIERAPEILKLVIK